MFLSVPLSYLQQSLHVPDLLSSLWAVLHVIVDPAGARMLRHRCRPRVDDDL